MTFRIRKQQLLHAGRRFLLFIGATDGARYLHRAMASLVAVGESYSWQPKLSRCRLWQRLRPGEVGG